MLKDNDGAMPRAWRDIAARSRALGFDMPSEANTGAFLQSLAAAKPGGRLLELGTGTGLATACLLAGMDDEARLISLDNDERVQNIARGVLGQDRRVTFVIADGLAYLRAQTIAAFDLIFADAWPGKYEGLDGALKLLRPGGVYIVDDMLPQPNWPDGHQQRVDDLIARLKADPNLATTCIEWASGLVVATRRRSEP